MTSEVKMPVAAYLTNDEEGSPAMLFFDKDEAAEYTYEADPPQALVLESNALAAIEAARVEARAKALEEAACEAESWCGGKLLLAAGELTARELRTCRAVTAAIAARLRSLAKEAP